MQEQTRTTVFIGLGLFFVALLGIWWYFGFSLDFMRFFAAEPEVPALTATCRPLPPCLLPGANPACSVVEPPEGWCPVPPGNIVTCSPTTQTVNVGAAASLKASGGNGTYQWSYPGVDPDLNGNSEASGATVVFGYSEPGIKKITVESARGDGTGNVDSVACTVIVQPAGSI